jgi:hypothetical protein
VIRGYGWTRRTTMRLLSISSRRREFPRRIYQVTDRLHTRPCARVSEDEIISTVSAWLAELGVVSPLVEDLARAVRNGDWTSAYAIADCLSVDVAVAA